MGDQAVLRPALGSVGPETSAVTFERVLNSEEAAVLLRPGLRPPEGIGDPKTAFRAAREKLRRHWARTGFRRVRWHGLFGFVPCTKTPVVETDRLSPKDRGVAGTSSADGLSGSANYKHQKEIQSERH
jgi:hypothetical protein